MGKFGFHSGYVKAQNLQAGSATIDTDGNGDGSIGIAFKRKFKNTPIVILTPQGADTTGNYAVTTISQNSFIAVVDAYQGTANDVVVGYIAMDDPSTGFS